MLRLAAPVLLEQLLLMLVGMVDTYLCGQHLAGEHLAAMGLMAYVMWLIPSMFGVIAIGATALVARHTGAGESDQANLAMNQSFLAGCLLAVVVTLVVALGGSWFVHAVQLQGEAAPLANRYLWILLPVLPAIMVEQVGIASLRGAGDMISGFVAMVIVNVVNVAVSASFVTGAFGLPRLGWDGLAIGTACGHAVGAIIVAALLLVGRRKLRLRKSLLAPSWQMIRRLLNIGIPGGADVMAIVLCHLWFLSIINSLGNLQAAAHGLGVRIESLAYLPGTAFQVAAATLAGQFLGADDYYRAKRSVWMACLVGGGLMVAAGFLFYFGAESLTQLFLGSQTKDAAAIAIPLLQLVSFSMPSLALTMILTGALRGAGDTRWPLVFTFIGLLGIRIPLAYWFAWSLKLGVIGAWYAMIIDLVVRSLLVTVRFYRGRWLDIKI